MDVTTFNPFLMGAWFLVFLFSTTVHEAAHAFASWKMGDSTARLGGQVTLDPRPHVRREPVGMVVIPVISFMLMGWMIGWASAPYDPHWAWRHPRRAAWMALAGPASNLALMLLAIIGIRIGIAAGVFYPPDFINMSQTVGADGAWTGLGLLLSIFFSLNMILFVFNLLPMPPLDGSGALPLLMNDDTARRWMEAVRQPGFAIFGLIVAWILFRSIIGPVHTLLLGLLYPGLGYG